MGLFDQLKSLFEKKPKVDYSFGLQDARDVLKQLKTKKYSAAEELILHLSTDNLSVTIDYVTLTWSESELLLWNEKSNNNQIPNLFLGAHYLHMAWISRGYQYASEVSESEYLGFAEYIHKSLECLRKFPSDRKLLAECYSRLIRAYMGEGDHEQSMAFFNQVITVDPTNVWAYLHYAEVIQPKWGGNLELVNKLLEMAPKGIVYDLVELKLIHDSMVVEENYFEDTNPSIHNLSQSVMNRIHAGYKQIEPSSIHKLIVYNYMVSLAMQTDNGTMLDYYAGKINGYYTLYPCGIIR